MTRLLFAFALGGAITLSILASTSPERFTPWAVGFIIAAMMLFFGGTVVSAFSGGPRARRQIEQARRSGALRAVLILDRRQTGMLVNEQPQIEYTLLVDRPDERPFVTKTRQIVQMIHLQDSLPGQVIAVAQPYLENSDVQIVEDQPPDPSPALTKAGVEYAVELPPHRPPRKLGANIALFAAAFLVGALGTPFLASPNALDFAKLVVEGRTDEAHLVEHPNLFEVEELHESLDQVTKDLGSDEFYSRAISDVYADAVVPSGPDGEYVEDIEIQDHKIVAREQDSAGGNFDLPTLNLSEVNWDGVFAGVPAGQKVAEDRGLQDPALQRILIQREDSNLGRIVARMWFTDGDNTEAVELDAQGQVLPSEAFKEMTEEEQKNHLFSEDNLLAALAEIREHMDSDLVSSVSNYGDRLTVEARVGEKHSVQIDYRHGMVTEVGDQVVAKVEPGSLFRLDDDAPWV